jgi:hypothetical protein
MLVALAGGTAANRTERTTRVQNMPVDILRGKTSLILLINVVIIGNAILNS